MASVGQVPSESEVREMVRIADADGSGEVDFYEVQRSNLYALPSDKLISHTHVRSCTQTDHDKPLNTPLSATTHAIQFVALMAHKMSDPANEASVAEAFALFDRNGDGQLNKSELAKLMMNVGEPATMDDIDGLLDALDMNGDGSIGKPC